MLRSLTAAAVLLALPCFADDEEPTRSEPEASYAAEAVVQKVTPIPSEDGVDWAEVTLKVTRCIAGACSIYQSVTVRIAFSQWRGKHGETMGIVRYDWKDQAGGARSWSMAHRLDDADEAERFERDSEKAVATVGAVGGDSAVATR